MRCIWSIGKLLEWVDTTSWLGVFILLSSSSMDFSNMPSTYGSRILPTENVRVEVPSVLRMLPITFHPAPIPLSHLPLSLTLSRQPLPFLGSSYEPKTSFSFLLIPASIPILTLVLDQRADNCREPRSANFRGKVTHVIAHLRRKKIDYLTTRYTYTMSVEK